MDENCVFLAKKKKQLQRCQNAHTKNVRQSKKYITAAVSAVFVSEKLCQLRTSA